ncbi:hypothetical protein Tco_0608217 [Tanacetum coccineum]
MITYGLCQRTTGYDKIQKNDLWLLSMFDARHQNRYANVAWLIARWMKRKGAGTQRESQICCGQFIMKISRKSRVLTDAVLRSLSALIYCRDLDTTTLRELIDSKGRLIPEDLQPGVPRDGIPGPPRASMQDLELTIHLVMLSRSMISNISSIHLRHHSIYLSISRSRMMMSSVEMTQGSSSATQEVQFADEKEKENCTLLIIGVSKRSSQTLLDCIKIKKFYKEDQADGQEWMGKCMWHFDQEKKSRMFQLPQLWAIFCRECKFKGSRMATGRKAGRGSGFIAICRNENGSLLTIDEVMENVSTVSSAGTQIKSGSSRFNTGKQNVNSGSVHVNTARVIRPTIVATSTTEAEYAAAASCRGQVCSNHNHLFYDSLVKQFWQTATARTLADGTQQLNATIDSIEYTITEESVRRQLQLADASGITCCKMKRFLQDYKILDQLNLVSTPSAQVNTGSTPSAQVNMIVTPAKIGSDKRKMLQKKHLQLNLIHSSKSKCRSDSLQKRFNRKKGDEYSIEDRQNDKKQFKKMNKHVADKEKEQKADMSMRKVKEDKEGVRKGVRHKKEAKSKNEILIINSIVEWSHFTSQLNLNMIQPNLCEDCLSEFLVTRSNGSASQKCWIEVETEEESTMALELIKFVNQQQKKIEDFDDDDLANLIMKRQRMGLSVG